MSDHSLGIQRAQSLVKLSHTEDQRPLGAREERRGSWKLHRVMVGPSDLLSDYPAAFAIEETRTAMDHCRFQEVLPRRYKCSQMPVTKCHSLFRPPTVPQPMPCISTSSYPSARCQPRQPGLTASPVHMLWACSPRCAPDSSTMII